MPEPTYWRLGLLLLVAGGLIVAHGPPVQAQPLPRRAEPALSRSPAAGAIVADDVSRLEQFLPDAASLQRPIDWDGIKPTYGVNPRLGRVAPIWAAIEAGATHVLRWLLERGVSPNTRLEIRNVYLQISTPLELAIRLPSIRDFRANVGIERWTSRDAEVVRLLLHHGADVFAQSSNGSVPLSLEGSGHPAWVLDLLLTNAIPVTARDSNGTTLLHVASAHHRGAAMDFLLRAGLSPSAKTPAGLTPMQACFLSSNPQWVVPRDCIQHLRDAGAPMDVWVAAGLGDFTALDRILADTPGALSQSDAHGRSPLHYAVSSGRLDVLEYLLGKGADPNTTDRDGNTALHIAAPWGLMDMLKVLVKAGGDLDPVNQAGETPLVLGLRHPEVAEFLLDAGALAEPEGAGVVRPLVRALEWQVARPALLRTLIRHGARLDRPAPDGSALIFVAMEQPNDLADIASLIRFGANLETQDSEGNTLLLRASRQGAREVESYSPPVSLAREFATRPDWRREVHDWLVARGVISPKPASTQQGVSVFLLKLGANPKATNHLGETALHVLARRSTGISTNIALALLRGGVDPMVRDRDGYTFLHRIADPGDPFLAGEAPSLNAANLKTLFQAWPPPKVLLETTNPAGQTAFQAAVSRGYPSLAEVLGEGPVRSQP